MAACSPRNFSGEQVARTYEQEHHVDGTYVQHMVDSMLRQELQKYVDIHEVTEVRSLNEVYSAPDSTGQQHVKERTKTTMTKRSETSAGSTQVTEVKIQQQVDSTVSHASQITAITEDEKRVNGKVEGWLPWYVYVAALVVAVIIGFILYRKGKKSFKMRLI